MKKTIKFKVTPEQDKLLTELIFPEYTSDDIVSLILAMKMKLDVLDMRYSRSKDQAFIPKAQDEEKEAST